MTAAITETQLENAASDSDSLSAFVNNGTSPGIYTTRTGRTGKTLAKIESDAEAGIAAIVAAGVAGSIGGAVIFASSFSTGNDDTDIANADAAGYTAGTIVFLDRDFTLGANKTLTAKWIYAGGVITPNGHTLTGYFWAPETMSMFDMSAGGTVTFSVNQIVSPYWVSTGGTPSAYTGFVSVAAVNCVRPQEFGGVGDGSTPSATAFNAALAIASAKRVPLDGGNLVYAVEDTLTVASGVELRNAKLISALTANVDMLTVTGGSYSGTYGSKDGIILRNVWVDGSTSSYGNDLIRVTAGLLIRLTDCYVRQAIRDCVHVEPANTGDWTEDFSIDNSKLSDPGRDGIHFELPSGFANCFANLLNFTNVEVKSATGAAASFVNNNTSSANNKMGHITFTNCELSGSGAVSTPLLNLQGASSIGSIGNVLLNNTTVEDTASLRTGYGILCSGTLSGFFRTINSQINGFAAGTISGANLFPQFDYWDGNNSDFVFRSTVGINQKWRSTGNVTAGATVDTGIAVDANHFLTVFGKTRYGGTGYYGRWSVYNTRVQVLGTEVGMTLSVSGGTLHLQNTTGADSQLELYIQYETYASTS